MIIPTMSYKTSIPAIRFLFPFIVKAIGICPLYDKPGGSVKRNVNDNREMEVWEVRGAWLRVYPPAGVRGDELWVAWMA